MNQITPLAYTTPDDPSELGWPASLPIELALRVASPKEICEAHGVSHAEWTRLRYDPGFQQVVQGYVELLKKDGMSFRLKAQLQAEELLKVSWELIHGKETPAVVKADLIKHTTKVAGLDASLDQKNGGVGNQNNFQIVLNLGET
jgi:hypothetical protein